jgi:hypothetical protein
MKKKTNLPDGFSFNHNIPPSGKWVTASETEEFLLEEQEATRIKYRETLFQLARFYGEGTVQYEIAFQHPSQLGFPPYGVMNLTI